jgi:RNA polymerase sigma-70 factor (ECF subfamily)
MPHVATTEIRHWIEGLQDTDAVRREEARTRLINETYDRLQRHTCRIRNLHFPQVSDATDDVHQGVMLRLWKALESFRPANVGAFFSLAAKHIRYELLDRVRARRPDGTEQRDSAAAASRQSLDPTDGGTAPDDVVAWTEFHQLIERLPPDAKEIVDLLFYWGFTHREAAELLEVPETTVQSRWRNARVRLALAMRETLPGLNDSENP